jgi:hypothetical protein
VLPHGAAQQRDNAQRAPLSLELLSFMHTVGTALRE